jgi:hypothetical protein
MLEPTTKPTQQPTPEPMRRRLGDGGEGGRGETKASSSLSLSLLSSLSNKFCASARKITTTPLANAQAKYRANSTTNPQTNVMAARRQWQGQQGGDKSIIIIIIIVK